MDDFNKEKLDTLFQEGSERYDFTYREDAWTTMDGMLDGQEKKRKKRFFLWCILIVVTALIGVFGLKHLSSGNQLLTQTDRPGENTTTSAVNDKIESTPKIAKDEITVAATTEKSAVETKYAFTAASDVVVVAKDLPENEKNNKNISIQTTVNSENSNLENIVFEQKTQQEIQQIPLSTPTEIVSAVSTNLVPLPSGTVALSTKMEEPLVSIDLPAITLYNSGIALNAKKSKLSNRFSVGLTAAPEVSFVGGGGEAKAGYYLGVELGYQLTNRFELITGIGVSKKRYIGDGANYKTEPGFWTDEIAPMQFDGTCTVIEIPIAVNYYFNDAKENGWFASLGATTYLMSSEWYDFIYDPAINRSDLKANWNDKMANNHLLGVGQVSFGYQHKIGNKMSLQFSPYAKIPLTGIGNGSVNLFSTGLRITAKLR